MTGLDNAEQILVKRQEIEFELSRALSSGKAGNPQDAGEHYQY